MVSAHVSIQVINLVCVCRSLLNDVKTFTIAILGKSCEERRVLPLDVQQCLQGFHDRVGHPLRQLVEGDIVLGRVRGRIGRLDRVTGPDIAQGDAVQGCA